MATAPAPLRPQPARACVIVTRPEPEASAWADALRQHGCAAQALPLIHIGEPCDADDRQRLQHWRTHWPTLDALMFVSGAAVHHFFAADEAVQPDRLLIDRSVTRFWAPGPGTARVLAQALARLGISAQRIDAPPADAAQFDSEHLWPVVASQMGPGRRLLIVRGRSPAGSGAGLPGTGRDWLIRRCAEAGATVDACVAYERSTPQPDGALGDRLRAAAGAGCVWLLSSSEALQPLARLQPPPDWVVSSALVTHPRIAESARALGFGRVIETRPALPDILRTLESLGWIP